MGPLGILWLAVSTDGTDSWPRLPKIGLRMALICASYAGLLTEIKFLAYVCGL